MGSPRGIVNKVVGSGALGVVGGILRQQKLSAEKKGRQEAAAGAAAASKAEAAARQAAIDAASEEAKKRARKKTIFAGADIEKNIFSKTLGGSTGNETLG